MTPSPGPSLDSVVAGFLQEFARGHRPHAEHRLGLEHEFFLVEPDGVAAPYSGPRGVEAVLQILRNRLQWAPVEEGGRLLGLRADDGRAYSLEPGAQVEFATRPCRTVAELQEEFEPALAALVSAAAQLGLRVLSCGSHPTAAPEQIERIPKDRYNIMEPWLAAADKLGVWMMKTTCGMQVNFDHTDAADAARKLRVGFHLAPALTALFANSPLRAGEESGFATWRGRIWEHTDPTRCGLVEASCAPGATLEDFARWAAAAPVIFPGTETDLDLRASLLFPEIRLRPQLELRCTDSVRPAESLALCSLVEGIFGHEDALQTVLTQADSISFDSLEASWKGAHRSGLAAAGPDGRPLRDHAVDLLALARAHATEPSFLTALDNLLSEKDAQPQDGLAKWTIL